MSSPTYTKSTFSGRTPPPGFEDVCPVGSPETKGYRGGYLTDEMVRIDFLTFVEDHPMPHPQLRKYFAWWRYRLQCISYWTEEALDTFEWWIQEYKTIKKDVRRYVHIIDNTPEAHPAVKAARNEATKLVEEMKAHEWLGVKLFWVGRTYGDNVGEGEQQAEQGAAAAAAAAEA